MPRKLAPIRRKQISTSFVNSPLLRQGHDRDKRLVYKEYHGFQRDQNDLQGQTEYQGQAANRSVTALQDRQSTSAAVHLATSILRTSSRTRSSQSATVPKSKLKVQTKLVVGQPNDTYEQEADRIADQVMQMSEPIDQQESEPGEHSLTSQGTIQTKPLAKQVTPLIQRQETLEELPEEKEPDEEEETTDSALVQTKRTNSEPPVVTPDLEAYIKAKEGSGQPLPTHIQDFFEARFGCDFRQIRIHQDSAAADELKSQAFTYKQDIYFGQGKYDPNSTEGKRLLAHELTHTIQQQPSARHNQAINNGSHSATGSNLGIALSSSLPLSAVISSVSTTGQELISRRVSNLPSSHSIEGPLDLSTETPLPESNSKTSIPTTEEFYIPTEITEESQENLTEQSDLENQTVQNDALSSSELPAQSSLAEPASGLSHQPVTSDEEPPQSETEAVTAVPSSPEMSSLTTTGPSTSEEFSPATKAAPVTGKITFTGEPSQMVEQLQKVSPVRAPFIFQKFTNSVRSSLGVTSARYYEHAPRAKFQPKAASTVKQKTSPKKSLTETPRSNAIMPALDSSMPPIEKIQPHQHKGKPPKIKTDRIPISKTDKEEQEEGLGFIGGWIRKWVNQFIHNIPTKDLGVNTEPGETPKVTLTGKANPKQMGTFVSQGRTQLVEQYSKSRKDLSQDFGENSISPDIKEKELVAPLKQRDTSKKTDYAPDKQAKPLVFDPEDEEELSARVHPQKASEYAALCSRVSKEEQKRDNSITSTETKAQKQIAEAHTKTHLKQTSIMQDVQKDVSSKKAEWNRQNQGIPKAYEEQSNQLENQTDKAIKDKRQSTEKNIDQKHKKVRQEATSEKNKVQKRAQAEREKVRKESRTWFSHGLSWLGDKLKSMTQALNQKIGKWFKDFRASIKRSFDSLKAWSIKKIGQAQTWIVNKLGDFRKTLHVLVDRHLGRFPVIASVFKQKINSAIGIAQKVVNTGAEALKKTVSALLSSLAIAIDTSLASVEFIVVDSFSLLSGIVVSGFNLIILMVEQDLESLIQFIRDLPPISSLDVLTPVIKSFLLGGLENIRDETTADEKKRLVKKMKWLLVSPFFHLGTLGGVFKGIVWDGLVGTVTMVYDVIVGLKEVYNNISTFAKNLFVDLDAVKEIFIMIDEVKAEVNAFMERPDALDKAIAFIKRSPKILFSMVKQAAKKIKESVYKKGAEVSKEIFYFILDKKHHEIGFKWGSILGEVVFEVVLAIISYGGAAAFKAAARVIKVLIKGLRMITEGIAKGGGVIFKALKALQSIIKNGLKMAQKVSNALRKIFDKLETLTNRVFKWFRKALKRSSADTKNLPKPRKGAERGRGTKKDTDRSQDKPGDTSKTGKKDKGGARKDRDQNRRDDKPLLEPIAKNAVQQGWKQVKGNTKEAVLPKRQLLRGLKYTPRKKGVRVTFDIDHKPGSSTWCLVAKARHIKKLTKNPGSAKSPYRGWVAQGSLDHFTAFDQSKKHEKVVKNADKRIEKEASKLAGKDPNIEKIHKNLIPKIKRIEKHPKPKPLRNIAFDIKEGDYKKATGEDSTLLYSYTLSPNTSQGQIKAKCFNDLPNSKIEYLYYWTEFGGILAMSMSANILTRKRPKSGEKGNIPPSSTNHPLYGDRLFWRAHKDGKTGYYVRGHLLNHNIHGPGDYKNLVPLSKEGNRKHREEVEDKVKDAVNKKGFIVRYSVDAFEGGVYNTPVPKDQTLQKLGFAKKDWKTIQKIREAENLVPRKLMCKAYKLEFESGAFKKVKKKERIVVKSVNNPIDPKLENYVPYRR